MIENGVNPEALAVRKLGAVITELRILMGLQTVIKELRRENEEAREELDKESQ